MTSPYIAAGSTNGSSWETHHPGAKLHVDTSSGNFSDTPVYTISIGGSGGSMWSLTGGTSGVYSPTPTGFDVYLKWADGASLTGEDANSFGWYVNWVGVENVVLR